jgi:hypothetical protein
MVVALTKPRPEPEKPILEECLAKIRKSCYLLHVVASTPAIRSRREASQDARKKI